jgi:multidrug efflux system outer membrane protein
MNKIGLLCLLAVALAGCTMAPRYERPQAPIARDWPTGPAYGGVHTNQAAATATASFGWREFFGDPRLQKLIELALANNRDLRVAVLNVDAARAQYRIARSALFPTIDAVANGSRQRLPGGLLGEGQSITYSQYSVGLGVTAYELDLFGRVRSLKAQALENYFASDEGRKSAHLSLLAQVAIQYLAEREFDEGLAITQKTLESVEAYYDLIQKSFDIGNSSELDLRSAEAQVQNARANVASYQRQRAQAENGLVLLVGRSLPEDLPLPQPLDAQPVVADLPAGLPSDLLQRRPDILAAEHQLKAANANIGAARAAFFPKITLTGSAGTTSGQLADLFAGGSLAWSYAPQITLPIFDAGNNLANLNVAKITKRIEIAQYEKAIQSAFREVADALAARATLETEIQAEQALVKAEEQRYNLAGILYRNGAENYLTVLTAQQDLYSAQQRLLQSRFARLANLVTLYKALGGGWQEHTAVARN